MVFGCFTECLLASMLAGSVFFAFIASAKGRIDTLENTLRPEQLQRLRAISSERARIAMTGLMLGVIVAVSVARVHPCISVLALFGIQHAYYVLMPKSDWMVPHLDTPAQREAWKDVYVGMKTTSHVGAITGIVVYAMVVYANRR